MENKEKTAQEIINESKEGFDFLESYYPVIFEQKQADENLTKILKNVKMNKRYIKFKTYLELLKFVDDNNIKKYLKGYNNKDKYFIEVTK